MYMYVRAAETLLKMSYLDSESDTNMSFFCC